MVSHFQSSTARSLAVPAPDSVDTARVFDQAADGEPLAIKVLSVWDVRGQATEEQASLLRSPQMIDAWRDALVTVNQEIQTQFAQRRATSEEEHARCLAGGPSGKASWFEYKLQYDRWRGAANAFKHKVEERLRENKRLLRDRRIARSEQRRSDGVPYCYQDVLRSAARFLRNDDAIQPSSRPVRDELVDRIEVVLRESRGWT